MQCDIHYIFYDNSIKQTLNSNGNRNMEVGLTFKQKNATTEQTTTTIYDGFMEAKQAISQYIHNSGIGWMFGLKSSCQKATESDWQKRRSRLVDSWTTATSFCSSQVLTARTVHCASQNSADSRSQNMLRMWTVMARSQHTIRYDTRCYFNVRSKADISQLNLPHGTDN